MTSISYLWLFKVLVLMNPLVWFVSLSKLILLFLTPCWRAMILRVDLGFSFTGSSVLNFKFVMDSSETGLSANNFTFALSSCLSFETIPKYLSSLDFSPKWLGGTDAILSTLTTILESIILQFIVCSYHIMYTFQSKSTLYSCLNIKELLAQRRCASLSDCNWTGTQHSTI